MNFNWNLVIDRVLKLQKKRRQNRNIMDKNIYNLFDVFF